MKRFSSSGRSPAVFPVAIAAILAGSLIGQCGSTDASPPAALTKLCSASQIPAALAAQVPQPAADWAGSATLARDWKTEPLASRTYDVAKAIERIGAVEPQQDARTSLYWVAVLVLKASTLRFSELDGDRQWEKEHLALDGVRLTVQAPLRIHEEFARNLRAWEESGLAQISVRSRVIYETLGPAAAFSAGRHPETVVLKSKDVLALMKAADKDKTASVSLASTNISATTFNGQRAAFVCSAQGAASAAQEDHPGAGVSERPIPVDGFRLSWQATESRDLKSIRVEGCVESTVPLATRPGDGSAPHLKPGPQSQPLPTQRTLFVSEVQDGQSLLIGGLPVRDQKRCGYVLLTVRHVAPPQLSKSSSPAATK
jgi:hypothetical protein